MSMLRNIKSGFRSLFRKELVDQELNVHPEQEFPQARCKEVRSAGDGMER